jgi:hypothetical protein
MTTQDDMPPRLLAIRIQHRTDAPTLARIEIRADDGHHSFLVTREILEMIANRCAGEASVMPKASELS